MGEAAVSMRGVRRQLSGLGLNSPITPECRIFNLNLSPPATHESNQGSDAVIL